MTYTYEVDRSLNTFGAGLGWYLTLYRHNQYINSWFFDDLAFAKTRLRKKIRWIKDVYDARPHEKRVRYLGKPDTYCGKGICALGDGHEGKCDY